MESDLVHKVLTETNRNLRLAPDNDRTLTAEDITYLEADLERGEVIVGVHNAPSQLFVGTAQRIDVEGREVRLIYNRQDHEENGSSPHVPEQAKPYAGFAGRGYRPPLRK